MKQEKIIQKLEKVLDKAHRELEAVSTDLPETKIGVDLDYQAERIKKVADDLKKAGTLIHGGGTGNDWNFKYIEIYVIIKTPAIS